jgi:membrane-associated protease RseP (regulator of RpoE activity)
MRRPLIVLGLLLFGTIAWACGDKLMLVMGARSSQIKPFHPAAILVYPGRSASAELIRGFQSLPAFRKAGHRFQLVEDSAGLADALKAGKYDVVVADVADANELSQQVSSAASKPILLPVAFKASKEEQSTAQKKYHCLLKAPGNSENYLEAIDQAMELKLKGATR